MPRHITLALLLAMMVGPFLHSGSEGCIQCKYKPSSKIELENRTAPKFRWRNSTRSRDELLEFVDRVSSLQRCPSNTPHLEAVDIRLPTEAFDIVRQKTELVAKILGDYYPRDEEKMLRTFVLELLMSNDLFYGVRIVWNGNGTDENPKYFASMVKSLNAPQGFELSERRNATFTDQPWLRKRKYFQEVGVIIPPEVQEGLDEDMTVGRWTEPYFLCSTLKWIISYTTFVYLYSSPARIGRRIPGKPVGLVSADVDVSDMDINQCDSIWHPENSSVASRQITAFFHSHKCHNRTSQCFFMPGNGWTEGSYQCICRDGFYSATGNPVFNGTLVEAAWNEKMRVRGPTYDMLYVCKPCQEGCDVCVDDSPCLSHYNWAFRISLLTISVICIILTLVLACYVYRFRKLKVIKVASPIFLCITLLGCAIMYSEMAAIFPVLEVYSCVATKWTRHMGFCITYSALLLKTWRVSLTYRVKSAHKLKLTDKQLLQWLFPILLVMAIYLGTWTISSPPEGIYIRDWDDLKFKQCDFNWWDHSLAIGEFLFLLWGIRVCYNVRNAESFFNEAKHISIAIYSITICNLVMIMIHLVILPNAGPDIKYLFGFIRTQLSTTVTIMLVFGPKFYRVIKGQGDTWDNRARARGVTASFSLNGVGLVHEEATDLYQENEELKEEIQKLAAQIEFMRIVHMGVNNRHLKPKHGSFFCNQSPITKSMYMKFESTDSPGSRVSPAAELVSERV